LTVGVNGRDSLEGDVVSGQNGRRCGGDREALVSEDGGQIGEQAGPVVCRHR
jgi:hypothetical protein